MLSKGDFDELGAERRRGVNHGASNSRNLLEYAKRREAKELIQIINICESEVVNE